MLRRNIKYSNEINLYLNGKAYSYQFHSDRINTQHFLIPRTHLHLFEKDLKQIPLSIVYKSEGKFYGFEPHFPNSVVDFAFFENVWGYENYFEFKVTGKSKLMDEVDIRDLKINTILENEI
jgi:hypothetical protein